MKKHFDKHFPSTAAALLLSLLLSQPALAADQAQMTNAAAPQKLSLKTANAEEGFALAVVLARKGVTTTQKNKEVLHALRPGYANNADSLIAASHVVAVHFQTIAAANNYWRD